MSKIKMSIKKKLYKPKILGKQYKYVVRIVANKNFDFRDAEI